MGRRWVSSGPLPLTGDWVTHVYCPECYAEMMAKIDQFRTRLKVGDRSRPQL